MDVVWKLGINKFFPRAVVYKNHTNLYLKEATAAIILTINNL